MFLTLAAALSTEWDDDDPLEQVMEEEKVDEIIAKGLQEFGRQEGGVPQQNSPEGQGI